MKGGGVAMDGKAFAEFLEERARQWYVSSNMGAMKVLPDYAEDRKRVRTWVLVRLKQGFLNEIDACHIAAKWLLDAPVEIKRMLARQVEDEAKHMELLGKRLRDLGEDAGDWEPMRGYRKIFDRSLAHTGNLSTRMALFNFGAELVSAYWGNEPMIEVFERADPETAAMYRNVIQKDEIFHTAIGRTVIERYATTAEIQAEALAEQDWLFLALTELKTEYNQRLRQAMA
jgi:uncharacterized ferritin-like protein (DUF455 family)